MCPHNANTSEPWRCCSAPNNQTGIDHAPEHACPYHQTILPERRLSSTGHNVKARLVDKWAGQASQTDRSWESGQGHCWGSSEGDTGTVPRLKCRMSIIMPPLPQRPQGTWYTHSRSSAWLFRFLPGFVCLFIISPPCVHVHLGTGVTEGSELPCGTGNQTWSLLTHTISCWANSPARTHQLFIYLQRWLHGYHCLCGNNSLAFIHSCEDFGFILLCD